MGKYSDIRIHSNIFDEYIHSQKYSLIFHGRLYSDIHLWYFFHAEYILIFICQISMVMNIYGYSFVQKFDIRPTLLRTPSVQIVPTTLVTWVSQNRQGKLHPSLRGPPHPLRSSGKHSLKVDRASGHARSFSIFNPWGLQLKALYQQLRVVL